MPVEAKPLFRPDVLRSHLDGFALPQTVDTLRERISHWANLIATGRLDSFNEQEILRDFLNDFFIGILGYTRPAGNERYTISWERHVEVDGNFADAVLGDFNGEPHYVVALEGKGPRDPLDRPYAGRRISAVDQGYNYAINFPCDWIIVTSIRQTRLYHKGSDKQTFERFDTELLDNDAALRRFVYLLAAERVVPDDGNCHFETLLAESEQVGRELTKKFYLQYANMRHEAYQRLCQDNPAVPRDDVLARTQKLLDRVLFVAFSEDRGLLPRDTIADAYEHRDPYNPRPVWENFRGLFRQIDRGNAARGIHAYNGGLFADDPVLDSLAVSDEVCGYFHDLGGYDYRPVTQIDDEDRGKLIDVDILGHIFEQSITDLERLRNELEGRAEPVNAEKHKTRRKKEGAFYTPAFITRYIIEQALGGVLRDRFEQLRAKRHKAAKGVAKEVLIDPNVYDINEIKQRPAARKSLIAFWEAWQDDLKKIRILDPACGSGAFLVEAFDQLFRTFELTNARLHELRGPRELFDLNKQILEHNLYGVDINGEAIEICRLSLWIKTAKRGKVLSALDHSIREGNSVVDDPAVHPKALDWQAAFPEVFAQGGFDVVVANPPYVRQELLSPYKPYFESAYQAYHGMADLYVYFYELGLRLLKPGGLLSFVVTNKWMKSGYGEPLRRYFADHAWIESVVDFGHAKQIFEDADVFPSIIVARRPTDRPKPTTARLCAIPREQLRVDDLSRQIETEGFECDLTTLDHTPWSLEPRGVSELITKLVDRGIPLKDYSGIKPLYGVKTGYNEAFLIDSITREKLVDAHPECTDIVRPYLRGQDIRRWIPEWAGLWMIFTRRGIDIERYPSVLRYLSGHRAQLEPKPEDWSGGDWIGRKAGKYKWYEIQDPVVYWEQFNKPKLCIQRIAYHSRVALDRIGMLLNDAAIILPTTDLWLLCCLNSPANWYYAFRSLPHKKDEALAMDIPYVEKLPIPRPTDKQYEAACIHTKRLIDIADSQVDTRRKIIDWLCVQHEIAKPSKKLQAPVELTSDAFVAEVKKVRGKRNPLSVAALKNLREEHARTIEPARALAAEALQLERHVSDLVNEAYGLTPEEVALMWATAPPRMPFSPVKVG